MSLFTRVTGTVAAFFHIGGPAGSAWKNNSGNLDARNSGDLAYVNVRGLDPAAAQDFVTQAYFNANIGTAATINLLLSAPGMPFASNYAVMWSGAYASTETWTNPSTSHNIRTIAYTYTGSLLTQEVWKVFAADGTTITGQVTYTYTFTLNRASGGTTTRNV